MTNVRPSAISLPSSFRNLDEIPSGSEALFGFRSFRNFLPPAKLTKMSGIDVHLWPTSGGVRPFGFEKTLENWLLRMLAFSVSSMWICPLSRRGATPADLFL